MAQSGIVLKSRGHACGDATGAVRWSVRRGTSRPESSQGANTIGQFAIDFVGGGFYGESTGSSWPADQQTNRLEDGMRIIRPSLGPLGFVTSRAVTATLSVMGASCARTPQLRRLESRERHRPSNVPNLADRRRTPSGEDDQHLYTVNL